MLDSEDCKDEAQDLLSAIVRAPLDRIVRERETGQNDAHPAVDMSLYPAWDPAEIKLTPERVYAIAMHPSTTKPLAIAADKIGYIGLWDLSATTDRDEPLIHHFRLHSRTISSFVLSSDTLYTSSYDATIRSFNMETSSSAEIFYPGPEQDDDLLTCVQLRPDGNVLYFSSTAGNFGVHDLRQPSSNTLIHSLHEKKIGHLSLNPVQPDIFCTSSNDRTLKMWDIRKLDRPEPLSLATYQASKSISSAMYNMRHHIVATCYDDSLTIFNTKDSALAIANGSDQLVPSAVIPHDNQTGRWVTVFKARWHENPASGVHKIVVGNMKRSIDIYADNGQRINLLTNEKVTAVPAAVAFHPTEDWVVGGTASGKGVAYGITL